MGLPATLAQRHCITVRPKLSRPLRQPQRVRPPIKVSSLCGALSGKPGSRASVVSAAAGNC